MMLPSAAAPRAVPEHAPTDAERASEGASPPAGGAPPPVPAGLQCKLTRALLDDAWLAEDGYSYNKAAWEAYTAAHPHALVSPKTVQPVSACIVPNRHLKTLASEWRTWHAAQPPHAQAFDLREWVEDSLQGEVMRQPVALPDGTVYDLSTARELIFGNPQHPGRSLVDRTVTFNASQKVLRDLNVLELSEEVLGLAPGTLPRTYVVPTIGAMLGSRPSPLNVQAAVPAARVVGGAPVGQPQRPARYGCANLVVVHLLAAAYVTVAIAPLFVGAALSEGAWGVHAPKGVTYSLCIGGAIWMAALLLLPAIKGGPNRLPRAPAGANAV